MKDTGSSRAISAKQRWIALTVARTMATVLFVSTVLFVNVLGSMRAHSALEPGYRLVSFSAGASPSAAKVDDLDCDGRNDIAVVNLQGSLQLFFNNGAGSFERISLEGLPASSNTLGLDIGDLNGDEGTFRYKVCAAGG